MLKLVVALCVGVAMVTIPAELASAQDSTVVIKKRRPTIVITPRHQKLSANAKRHCEAELVKEVSPRGTYIVPRTYCWWQ